MLFALGRDGLLRRELAGVSAATGAPVPALALELTFSLAAITGFAIAGTPALRAFFYLATIGILSLLVMYVITNLGALRYLFLSVPRRAPLWEVVVPVGGIAFAGYTLYKNVWPVPAYPFDVFPYVVGGWLALACAIAFAVPGLDRKIETQLRTRTGAEDAPAAQPATAL
jgi:amino acid transporter